MQYAQYIEVCSRISVETVCKAEAFCGEPSYGSLHDLTVERPTKYMQICNVCTYLYISKAVWQHVLAFRVKGLGQ